VALKIIKLGMDSRQIVARFEAERQALAMMDHPNIARIFDADTTDTGRPYFVMELVRGIKITEYCDQNQLPTRERLNLFILVCQAIQHAHQKGIIHRDIKPSNILVTLHDGLAVPKVIDFGIAKATQQELTDKTLFTQFQQFIGTPAYISPEQAEMSGLDIDTRADIYSLGVLLYELLVGQTPFDAKEMMQGGLDALRRIIREKEPLRPSTKLNTLQGDARTTVGKLRQTDVGRLVHQLQGDLDWIVMKCLEKDRQRRYETASGLAMDVQRHLDNEPVVARPPSKLYEFQKTVKRHKIGFAAAGGVILALAIGLGIATWTLVKEKRARERADNAEQEQKRQRQIAESKEKQSQEVAEFLKDMLKGVGPSVALGRDTALLKEVLYKSTSRVESGLRDQPVVAAELLATLGNVYVDLGDYTNGVALLQKSLVQRKQVYGSQHSEIATSLSDLGQAFLHNGKFAEAESLQREALSMRITLLGEENLDVARSHKWLGEALRKQGKYPEAESHFLKSLTLRRKFHGKEDIEIADSLFGLGLLFNIQDKGDIAERYFRECLAMRRPLLGERHPEVLDTLDQIALALAYQGKYAEAREMQNVTLSVARELYREPHPTLATYLHNHGFTARNAGKLDEAEALLREALALRRKLLTPNHPNIRVTLIILADTHQRRGEFADAEKLIREAIDIGTRLFGAEDERLISSYDVLAEALRAQGKLEEADALNAKIQLVKKRANPDQR
jgi:tetratricopeptide (TPR) repeat protein